LKPREYLAVPTIFGHCLGLAHGTQVEIWLGRAVKRYLVGLRAVLGREPDFQLAGAQLGQLETRDVRRVVVVRGKLAEGCSLYPAEWIYPQLPKDHPSPG
jgi:hypothetical protein